MQRAACDSCHRAKSRCSKETERCNRCTRLELACTYSSPLRMGRPSYRKADEELSTSFKETSQHDARQSKRVKQDSDSPFGLKRKETTAPQNEISDYNLNNTASSSSRITQPAPHLQNTSFEDAQRHLKWLTEQPAWMFPCMNDFSVSSLDDYSTTLVSDAADPTNGKAKDVEEPTDSVDLATTAAELDTAVSSRAEANESDDGSSSSDSDQRATCLHQLSRLQSALYGLLLASNENKRHDCPSEGFQSPTSLLPATAGLSKIDEAFAATQIMFEILEELTSTHTSQGSPSGSSSELCYPARHGRALPSSCADHHADHRLRSCHPPELGQDSAAILLILTCYLRLLHVYEGHTVSLQQYLRQSQDLQIPRSPELSSAPSSSTSQDCQLSLPAFSIGSFNFDASTNFNTRLLLQAVEQMLERLQTAVRAYIPTAWSSSAFSSSMGKATCQDPMARFQGPDRNVLSACVHDPVGSVISTVLDEVHRKESNLMRMLSSREGHHGRLYL